MISFIARRDSHPMKVGRFKAIQHIISLEGKFWWKTDNSLPLRAREILLEERPLNLFKKITELISEIIKNGGVKQ